MDSVVAKFYVSEVAKGGYPNNPYRTSRVTLLPVSGDGKLGENDAFAKASPSGKCEITIANPPAAEFFEVGEFYYLTFTWPPKD